MPDWATIGRHIRETSGRAFPIGQARPVGGGCINSAYILGDDGRQLFVKLNDAARLPMFEAEAEGLTEIIQSRSLRAPAPLCWGITGDEAYLVMEYLPLGGHGGAEQLGQGLAQMHRCTRPHFGWHRDNTIGATPQINEPCDDWVTFWHRQRLGYQLTLTARNGGHLGRSGEQLLARLGNFFTDYQPRASLLHGDLWSGNTAVTTAGEAVIFDPAVYFGDRETDLAMTELFGGFPPAFYAAYQAAWPLDPGYRVRKNLYNLYHILNHFNLFGGGYLGQAQRLAGQLLSEVR